MRFRIPACRRRVLIPALFCLALHGLAPKPVEASPSSACTSLKERVEAIDLAAQNLLRELRARRASAPDEESVLRVERQIEAVKEAREIRSLEIQRDFVVESGAREVVHQIEELLRRLRESFGERFGPEIDLDQILPHEPAVEMASHPG